MARTGNPGRASRKCRAADAVLLVVDVQQRLGDAMPGKVLNRVILNTTLLARTAALMEIPTLRTEQYPKGLGSTHAAVTESLAPSTVRFEKIAFSCCDADGFAETLARLERRQLVVVGMEAHICVLQTALDLHASEYEVFVVEDAVCSRRLENYQNALDRQRQCSISVVSAESVVFEWMETAAFKHFDAVQALLR